MKTIPKIKIIVLLLILVLLLIQVNAFTTNGTKQTFDFTITSGKNNELSGTDFKSFLVIGDIATVSNSSNFRTEMGFIRTTGYVIGEACEISISCVSGACCSGVCASSCPEEAAAASASSIVSAGGSSSVPISISSSDYVHFYTSIAADEETVLNINREILSVTTITFELNQELKDVTFSVKLVQNPEHDIKDAHQYFEIEDDKINDENLKYAIIQFKVRKDSGIIKGTVSLNKYNNKWNKLPTEFINEDAEFYYYESSMQSFSLFAITGTKLVEAGIGAGKIEEVIEIPEEEIETSIGIESVRKKDIADYISGKVFLRSITTVLLISSLVILFYASRTLGFNHIQNMNNKFYDLAFQTRYHLKSNRIGDAKKAYNILLPIYIELINSKINRSTKQHMYDKIRSLYEEFQDQTKN